MKTQEILALVEGVTPALVQTADEIFVYWDPFWDELKALNRKFCGDPFTLLSRAEYMDNLGPQLLSARLDEYRRTGSARTALAQEQLRGLIMAGMADLDHKDGLAGALSQTGKPYEVIFVSSGRDVADAAEKWLGVFRWYRAANPSKKTVYWRTKPEFDTYLRDATSADYKVYARLLLDD